MGWSYPEISLEDLMKLIKNFVDMLILASGYQLSGRLAHWDSHNIKKSFQWALFLENVSKGLTSSSDYEDSVKELDAALFELTSNPQFPQGLAHLSCSTLSKARDFQLEHLIQTFPLRESHLKAIIAASVEMDFSKLQRIDDDCIDVYREKLMRIQCQSLNLREGRNFVEGTDISYPNVVPGGKPANWVDGNFSISAIQQLRRRQMAVSHSSVVGNGLEHIRKTIGQGMHDAPGQTSNSEPTEQLGTEELPVESIVWNRWKSSSLSYMLDRRTMRLVSGTSLIFSAPEGQWMQMFERLKTSAGSDELCEAIEIFLLGCIADRWSTLIEHLMSVLYEPLTVSRLCQEVFKLPLGKPLNLYVKDGLMNPKEKGILGYLEVLVRSQLNQLWKLSPLLAAAAIPQGSQLFISYLCELEGLFGRNSLQTKCCSCIADRMKHRECEVAERIWCLYIFHVCRSNAA